MSRLFCLSNHDCDVVEIQTNMPYIAFVIKEIVRANIAKLIDELDGGVPTRAARRCGIQQRTLDRYYKGETQPTIEFVATVAKGYGFEAWQLLVIGFDPANPPMLNKQSKAERELYEKLKAAFTVAKNGQ